MAMIKTDTARQALRNRASLSVQERQILILCDGIRTRQEIAGWLGDSTLALIDSLAARGYLAHRPMAAKARTYCDSRDVLDSSKTAAPKVAAAATPASTSPAWAEARLMPIETDRLPSRSALLAEPMPASAATKRSLAACKMYAVGILQMQRGMDANQLLTQLNGSHDETDLVKNLLELLQFLQQKTNASYAESVQNHLGHLLPDPHREALNARTMSYG